MSGTQVAPRLEVPARPGVRGRLHPGPVLLVGALLVAPRFLNDHWVYIVITGLMLAIACLGLHVLTGWARQISLMHAGVVGSAVCVTGWASDALYSRAADRAEAEARAAAGVGPRTQVEFAWPDYDPYLLAGMGVGIGFAVLVYAVVGLVAHRMALAYVVMLTLAAQFALETYVFTEERFAGGMDHRQTLRPDVLGVSFGPNERFYYLVAVVLLAVVFLLHRLRRSRFGRSIVFAGNDPEAAAAAGVSPWRFRLAAWVVAGACAGIAGALQAPFYRSPPGILQYISFNSMVYLAVAVIAGGASLLAVVVVAVAVSLAPHLVLDWELNMFLVGGVGMAIGIALGPRGVGGAVMDLVTPGRRR